MDNPLKRIASLERRLIERREEIVDLALENAQLQDKLALYERFLGGKDRIISHEFEEAITKETIDFLIRVSPEVPKCEVFYTKGGKLNEAHLHELLGVLDIAKDNIKESHYRGFEDNDGEDYQDLFN